MNEFCTNVIAYELLKLEFSVGTKKIMHSSNTTRKIEDSQRAKMNNV
jgi:hypothetical protein